jgi:AcrR family transcriptional regulator
MTTTPAGKPRDAEATRAQLITAGRRRFAKYGYAATTVREIAGDAGVNVALINRYFDSKEGLFEECLATVGQELGQPAAVSVTVDQLIERLVAQIVGLPADAFPAQITLLLRTSGDERADLIRRRILESFARSMAGIAGSSSADDLLLRAQIVLSTALGIALVRSTIKLEPLTSATGDELSGPMGELLHAMLGA